MAKSDKVAIPRAILELHQFCATDDGRPNLEVVFCRRVNDNSKVYQCSAVNGCHLMAIEVQLAEDCDLPEVFAIPKLSCQTILRGAKKSTTFEIEVNDLRGDTPDARGFYNSGALFRSDSSAWTGFNSGSYLFLPIEQIIPKPLDHTAGATSRIGFNPTYVATLATWLKKVGLPSHIEFCLPKTPLESVLGLAHGETTDNYSINVKYTLRPCRR